MQKIGKWMLPPPTGDEEKDATAIFFGVALMISCVTTLFIIGATIITPTPEAIALSILSPLLLVFVTWLSKKGKFAFAASIVILQIVFYTTHILWTSSEGIHSIVISLYILALLLGALFFSNRALTILTLFVICFMAIIAYAETHGFIITIYTLHKPESIVRDFFYMAFLFTLLTITLRLVIERLRKNYRRALANEKELFLSNQSLAASEERYRMISDLAMNYVFSSDVDRDGIVTTTWIGGAFETISGYSLEEFKQIGGWRATIKPEDHALDDQAMAELHARKKTVSSLRIITKQGEIRWVRVFAHPIWDEAQDRLSGIYGAVQDITSAKMYQDEIERLNNDLENRVRQRTHELELALKELEAFSYLVSHDLRVPVRALNGYTGILLETSADQLTPRVHEYIERMHRISKSLGNQVDGLVTFFKMSNQSVSKIAVDPHELVQQVLDAHAEEIAGQEIKFIIGDLPPCLAEKTLLEQVFHALINNAIKFSRERSPAIIEISSTQQDDQLVYYVKDNGVGFDMQYSDKLFGAFQKLHQIGDYEGVGLSLALIHRIVQRHGGKIWAEARVNQGATFFFTLG